YSRTGSAFVPATVSGGGAVTGKNLGNFRTVYTGSNGSDQYTVRLDPTNANNLQILETLLGQSQITNTTPKSAITTLTINAGAGDDLITLAGSAAGAPLTLNGGTGNDTLNIESTPLSSLLFAGGLTVNEHDTLNVDSGTFTF